MTGGQVIEVANCDRWPGYRGGQLHTFHCILLRIARIRPRVLSTAYHTYEFHVLNCGQS
jgi:hypothetical protein